MAYAALRLSKMGSGLFLFPAVESKASTPARETESTLSQLERILYEQVAASRESDGRLACIFSVLSSVSMVSMIVG